MYLMLAGITNHQKFNLPKGHFANTHTQNDQNALVDAFTFTFFGKMTFWKLTISPSIIYFLTHFI
jgi:hypothetical protein